MKFALINVLTYEIRNEERERENITSIVVRDVQIPTALRFGGAIPKLGYKTVIRGDLLVCFLAQESGGINNPAIYGSLI